jgi:hypothetical protein
VFNLIKIRRVHRLVVVAGRDDPQPGRLVGVISLSDIMRALIVRHLPCKSTLKHVSPLFDIRIPREHGLTMLRFSSGSRSPYQW